MSAIMLVVQLRKEIIMFKKFVYVIAISNMASSVSAIASQDALAEYEAAYSNPAYVNLELPANDINLTLSMQKEERYKDTRLSATQVWDAEERKAWDPKSYIPHAVLESKSFDKGIGAQGEKTFMRTSRQKSWLNPNMTADVLEEVHVYDSLKKVIFLGRPVITATEGTVKQALFHVEHSVGGTEESPTNLWRIAFLTDDQAYTQKLSEMLAAVPKDTIPMFVRQYLDRVVLQDEAK